MKRAYFQATIEHFLETNENEILGELPRDTAPRLNTYSATRGSVRFTI